MRREGSGRELTVTKEKEITSCNSADSIVEDLALEAKVFLKHDEKGRGTRWFTSNSEPQNDSREARDNNVTGRRREGLYTKRQVSDDRTRQEGSRGSMLHCREQRDRNESSRRVVATGSTAAMVISTPTTLASQKPRSLNHDCLGR